MSNVFLDIGEHILLDQESFTRVKHNYKSPNPGLTRCPLTACPQKCVAGRPVFWGVVVYDYQP